MSFTYDITDLDTPLAKVRFEIGDTEEAKALFQDQEIELKLAERADDVLLTAADLCEVLARRYAADFDFSTDNQSFKRSQRVKHYMDLAAELRGRAEGKAQNVVTRRIDGYSDELDNRTTSESGRSGRWYTGWGDEDRRP